MAEKGTWESKLKKKYCIGLLGYNLRDESLSNEDSVSKYMHVVETSNENKNEFYDELTYVYIELTKFKKIEEEIETQLDKWIYFLKNLQSFKKAPDILHEKVFKEAFNTANLLNYTKEKKQEYQSSLKYYRDNINVIDTAFEEGRAIGYNRWGYKD